MLLRIISIEADRQRLGLSLKEVADAERENYAIENGLDPVTLNLDLPEIEEEPEVEASDETVDVVESEVEEAAV